MKNGAETARKPLLAIQKVAHETYSCCKMESKVNSNNGKEKKYRPDWLTRMRENLCLTPIVTKPETACTQSAEAM